MAKKEVQKYFDSLREPIRRAFEQGFSEKDIKKDLKVKGWPEEVIEEALGYIKPEKDILRDTKPVEEPKREKHLGIKPKHKRITYIEILYMVGILVLIASVAFEDYFIYLMSLGVLIILAGLFGLIKKRVKSDKTPDIKKKILSIFKKQKEYKKIKISEDDYFDEFFKLKKKKEPSLIQHKIPVEKEAIKIESKIDFKKRIKTPLIILLLGIAAFLIYYLIFVLRFNFAAYFTSRAFLYGIAAFFVVLIIIFINSKKTRRKKFKKEVKAEKIKQEYDITVSKLKKEILKDTGKYETDIDRLHKIVRKYKRIKISDIAKTFDIPKEQAENWAKILSEHNLADYYYPAIGEPELRSVKEAEKSGKENNRRIHS